MEQLTFDFIKKPYTREEIARWNSNTNFDPSLVPFWTWISWCVFGPPGSTGPR